GNQQIEQIADGDTDGRTVFDLGKLQELGVDQICGNQLKIDFDRDNSAAIAVALSVTASTGSVCHGGESSRSNVQRSGSGWASHAPTQPTWSRSVSLLGA